MSTTTTLKLPEFWEQNARAWFAQAEAQFAIKEITEDETRFYHVVAALTSATAGRVVSLLERPPMRNKYAALKKHLLDTFGLSEAERARQLLSLPGLGDGKPSELMDHMLALLGDHEPCFLFKEIFLQQLPDQVRLALANSPITDFRQLAREADKFFSAGKKCFAATPPATPPTSSDGNLHQPYSISATTTTVPRRPKQSTSTGMCFYHAKFGNKAKKCLPPCTFQASGNAAAGTC